MNELFSIEDSLVTNKILDINKSTLSNVSNKPLTKKDLIKAIKSLSRPLTKKEQEYARMTPFEFAAKVYPQTIPMLNKYNLL